MNPFDNLVIKNDDELTEYDPLFTLDRSTTFFMRPKIPGNVISDYPAIQLPKEVPNGFVIYLNANTSFVKYTQYTQPNSTVNNTSVSSWGPFTTVNSPIYYNNGIDPPCVHFCGGSFISNGLSNKALNQGSYMTCSVPINSGTNGGLTVFTYCLNQSISGLTRFVLSNGQNAIFMGNGQSKFTAGTVINVNPIVNYSTTDKWMTACWRVQKIDGTTSSKDVFFNGINSGSLNVADVPINTTLTRFSRAENGDLYGDPYWKGAINMLLIYPFALSDNEITNLDSYFRKGTSITGTLPNVKEYPPVALTSASTVVSGQSYGNGTYVTNSSSTGYNTVWSAFAKDVTNLWFSNNGLYSPTDGTYIGSTVTTTTTGDVNGEYIEITLPSSIFLYSFVLGYYSSQNWRTPKQFTLCGYDGTNFTNMITSGLTTTGSSRFFTNSSTSYNKYRLIIQRNGGSGSTYPSDGGCAIVELVLNGY